MSFSFAVSFHKVIRFNDSDGNLIEAGTKAAAAVWIRIMNDQGPIFKEE